MSDEWQAVGAASDVAEDEPLGVTVGDKRVGIFRIDGSLYAIDDICPHAFALLSQGFVEGEQVECPLHEALFHVPTGKCLREPAEDDVATYEVKEEDGRILVKI
jgi:3-phenylpropionate/trans-cinnamate dioxygenase ferredoxin subunit